MLIDITKIEGYTEMTLEEKIAALEAYQPDMTGFIEKVKFDKTASELAEAKRALRDKLSAEEQEKAAQNDQFNAMKAELELLRKEKTISEYKAEYISLGYDEALAKATAEAHISGDMETVFGNQKKYSDSIEKKVKAELMRNFPQPPSGSGEEAMTKDKFQKMSLAEKQQFAVKNPEEYKKMYE